MDMQPGRSFIAVLLSRTRLLLESSRAMDKRFSCCWHYPTLVGSRGARYLRIRGRGLQTEEAPWAALRAASGDDYRAARCKGLYTWFESQSGEALRERWRQLIKMTH